LLSFTGCKINTAKPEPASGNLENQEDINQSSNNSQSSSIGQVEEPVIEEDTETTGTVYPQKWATGDGTVENPWANDCIQKALDAVPAGGTVFLKSGYYTLSTEVEINKKVNIVGEGRSKAIIKTTSTNGIVVYHDNCTLKGFTIDGDSQVDGTKYLSLIVLVNCDYVVLEDIEVKNAGYYGIDIFQVNYSLFQNIHSHDNYRHGLHPGTDTTGRNKYNIYRDIYAYNNGNCGFNDRGNENNPDEECFNTYDGLNCWDNDFSGIVICYQRGGVLSNSSTSGNERGIYLIDIKDFNIHDCSTTLNGEEGLDIELSKNVSFTNVIVKNNNTSNVNDVGGILIHDSSDIRFASCQSYDDRETPLQAWGIIIEGTNTGISLLNCKLTPNQYGNIYNPNGIIVKVITEKRE
jgi:hypothetical protein